MNIKEIFTGRQTKDQLKLTVMTADPERLCSAMNMCMFNGNVELTLNSFEINDGFLKGASTRFRHSEGRSKGFRWDNWYTWHLDKLETAIDLAQDFDFEDKLGNVYWKLNRLGINANFVKGYGDVLSTEHRHSHAGFLAHTGLRNIWFGVDRKNFWSDLEFLQFHNTLYESVLKTLYAVSGRKIPEMHIVLNST